MKFRSLTSDLQVTKLEIQNNSEFQNNIKPFPEAAAGDKILTKSLIWVPGNLYMHES